MSSFHCLQTLESIKFVYLCLLYKYLNYVKLGCWTCTDPSFMPFLQYEKNEMQVALSVILATDLYRHKKVRIWDLISHGVSWMH